MALASMEGGLRTQRGRRRGQSKFEFAVYAPAEAHLPYLAVILSGRRPIEAFGGADRDEAKRILDELRARLSGRQAPD